MKAAPAVLAAIGSTCKAKLAERCGKAANKLCSFGMPGHSWLLIKPLWSASILLNKALVSEWQTKAILQPFVPHVNPKTRKVVNPKLFNP